MLLQSIPLLVPILNTGHLCQVTPGRDQCHPLIAAAKIQMNFLRSLAESQQHTAIAETIYLASLAAPAAVFMLCNRSAPSLHLSATQGVGLLLLKSHRWNPGPRDEHGNAAMEDFTPHVVEKVPKTNFPRGQRNFEPFERLAAMFQLVPSSIAFCMF